MKNHLRVVLSEICANLFGQKVDIELTRPEEQFGDYSTNVALKLAKDLGKNPREIAESLAEQIRQSLATEIEDVAVAGSGFINLKLNSKTLVDSLKTEPEKTLNQKIVVAEYSDPNPFKVLHVGHLYTTVVGDAIANLMETAGAEVHRVNYGGDVGLHVGKSMWAIIETLGGEYPDKLNEIAENDRPAWMAKAYVKGNTVYEENEEVKQKIKEYNKQVYAVHYNNDHESDFAKIYWTCRTWSYAAFDAFYTKLQTKMERYYPESEIAGIGLELVKQNIGTVFKESDGAVVFDGEAYGLHTRVFINSEGLPTYEAKEVGLITKKKEDYNYDLSVIVTAHEQTDYMKVVFKAIEQFLPELARSTRHLPHGMVRLAGGVKMSSRKGNIIQATEVINMTRAANKELTNKDDDSAVLGAIKYAFLKSRLGSDLIYDSKESVSLEGNSGPYLQYAHARARSILKKADVVNELDNQAELDTAERALLSKITEYPEVVDNAISELMPHHICTYLYELAQVFNRFYEHSRVIDDPRQDTRLSLVKLYADRLKTGLNLLGINAPDLM